MSKIWSKEETLWSFALYGTAIGAGTLFLPIQLGSDGLVVLLFTALVSYPLTYWPHKALCQFILMSNNNNNKGIIGATTYYYGIKISSIITLIYFFAFFVIVLIYAVALTNSILEQLTKCINVNNITRTIVSFSIILLFNLIFLMGENITIKIMSFLVFPLIIYFLFLSLFLIKNWQPLILISQFNINMDTLHQIWISIPVIVFSFSHTPIISTFAIDRQEKYGNHAMIKCKKIMKVTYMIMCLSIIFFIFSCLLSIPSPYIIAAKKDSITILSLLSIVPFAPKWLGISGIIVAIIVMSKSFLGTYFGVIEGATEIVQFILKIIGISKNPVFNRRISIFLISFITFLVCYFNPNAISMIYTISGPLISIILLIIPTISMWLIPQLKPYRSIKNLLIFIVGLLCTTVMFIK